MLYRKFTARQFLRIAKVGMRVKKDPDSPEISPCDQINDASAKSPAKVTSVSGNLIKVNNCEHGYNTDAWSLLVEVPADYKIELEGAIPGDEIIVKANHNQGVYKIIDRHGEQIFFLEGTTYGGEKLVSVWGLDELKRGAAEVVQPKPQVEELTLDQVCAELGRDIKIVKKAK